MQVTSSLTVLSGDRKFTVSQAANSDPDGPFLIEATGSPATGKQRYSRGCNFQSNSSETLSEIDLWSFGDVETSDGGLRIHSNSNETFSSIDLLSRDDV